MLNNKISAAVSAQFVPLTLPSSTVGAERKWGQHSHDGKKGSLCSSVTAQGRGHQLTWESQLAEDSAAACTVGGNAEKVPGA